jgi:hypothetical protein
MDGSRWATRRQTRFRAIVGILARVGRPAAGAVVADRVRGAQTRVRRRRARGGRSPARAQRIRWRQYRAVWGFVESPRAGAAALLRHFGDRGAAPGGALLRRVRPVARPRGGRVVRRSAAAGGGSTSTRDLEVIRQRRADRRAHPGGRDPPGRALEGGRQVLLRRLPGYGAFAHLRNDEVLTRVDELIAAGRLRSTGGTTPRWRSRREAVAVKLGVLASGSGTNLQALLDSVHGEGHPVVAVASDKPQARALQRAGDAGVATRIFPRADLPSREERDGAIAAGWTRPGSSWSSSPGYMQLLTPAFLVGVRAAGHQRHPSLLPAFPGSPRSPRRSTTARRSPA